MSRIDDRARPTKRPAKLGVRPPKAEPAPESTKKSRKARKAEAADES